jgi:hypothetical protein
MRAPNRREFALAAVLAIAGSERAAALGGRISQLRAVSGQVRAAIELREAFPSELRQVLESDGTLHIRVEAALWEDRPVWDRVVEGARVTVFRVSRAAGRPGITVIDQGGGATSYGSFPDPLTIDVDLAATNKLSDAARYYLNAVVTIGSLEEDEIEEANAAVFGEDDGPAGLKRIGKFLLNAVLQVSDYVRSVSTTIRSGNYGGTQLKKP